jgi:hypothetical protein
MPNLFVDKVYVLFSASLHIWSAPLDLSYYCSAPKTWDLDHGTFVTSGMQVQAFHEGPVGLDAFDFGPRELRYIHYLYTYTYDKIDAYPRIAETLYSHENKIRYPGNIVSLREQNMVCRGHRVPTRTRQNVSPEHRIPNPHEKNTRYPANHIHCTLFPKTLR